MYNVCDSACVGIRVWVCLYEYACGCGHVCSKTPLEDIFRLRVLSFHLNWDTGSFSCLLLLLGILLFWLLIQLGSLGAQTHTTHPGLHRIWAIKFFVPSKRALPTEPLSEHIVNVLNTLTYKLIVPWSIRNTDGNNPFFNIMIVNSKWYLFIFMFLNLFEKWFYAAKSDLIEPWSSNLHLLILRL